MPTTINPFKALKSLVIDMKIFLRVCILFFFTAIVALLVYGKKPLHLMVNHFHNPFQDLFFKYFTNVGDGIFVGIILITLLLFINLRNVLLGLATFLLSGIVCQLLKKVVYFNELRPAKTFGPNELHYIDGVVLNFYNSFPSGHTTTAFAIFLFLAYLFKKKYLQIVFAVIACLVAYSRVYLSQHFFGDVVCGGIIGITSFMITYSIFRTIRNNWFDKTILSLIYQNQSSVNKTSLA